VLLQLFVIYYGLASVIRLPAYLAAMLGLGLNYSAYESEIYRSALEAVPRGQLDAARSLGFTTGQALRLVRAPQAFRFALAPMTNDFVAMLKDSSLVSVLTVVELTKQTQIFATNIGSWVAWRCARRPLPRDVPRWRTARRSECAGRPRERRPARGPALAGSRPAGDPGGLGSRPAQETVALMGPSGLVTRSCASSRYWRRPAAGSSGSRDGVQFHASSSTSRPGKRDARARPRTRTRRRRAARPELPTSRRRPC
jgi:polar amino acid transport system substrate-binding protein